MRLKWVALGLVAVVTACGSSFSSSSSDGGSGAGGTDGGGATGGSAGTGGVAGASGVGGTGAAAGASGSGGTGAAAGASGSGGTGGVAGASGAGGGGAVAGTGGSGGTGGANSGDCDANHPCPTGSQCTALLQGGYRVCATPPVEATTCSHVGDLCCSSAQCSSGQHCYLSPVVPSCGGAVQLDHNVCAGDNCKSNADCGASAICLPAGVLGNKVRACLAVTCHTDADCTDSPGGKCAPVMDPCCNTATGLYCVYADGCRKKSDCATDEYCSTSGGSPHCVQGSPMCPG